MKVLLVLATLLAVSFAQDAAPLLKALEHRIAGGEEAVPHEFPYQAGLFIQLKPEYEGQKKKTIWCGGSILSEDYVITAAHCLVNGEVAVVFIGAHKIWAKEPERQMIGVTLFDWTVHPKYDHVYSVNDIALIKVSEKIKLTKYAQPIELPRRSQESIDFYYRLATVSGWGLTGDYQPTSEVLRFVNRRIKDDSTCELVYGPLFLKSNVCVDGSNGKSVCAGDSGGPLAVDMNGTKTLVGLTSYGRKEGCELGYPTVFTRISSYLDWIHSVSGLTIKE